MTKQQLWRIRRELISAKIMREELNQLKAGLLPGAICYDADRVQTSPEDRQAEILAQAVDLEREICKKLWDLAEDYTRAYREIEALGDIRERQVLHLYFLNANGYSMEEVAAFMRYSQRQTYRIYQRGVQNVSRISSSSKRWQ